MMRYPLDLCVAVLLAAVVMGASVMLALN